MTDDLFGKKDFGAIFGVVQIFFVATSSLGVIVSGLIYDLTQSYKVAWFIFLGLFILSMFCILIANGMKKKKHSTVEEMAIEESMEGI